MLLRVVLKYTLPIQGPLEKRVALHSRNNAGEMHRLSTRHRKSFETSKNASKRGSLIVAYLHTFFYAVAPREWMKARRDACRFQPPTCTKCEKLRRQQPRAIVGIDCDAALFVLRADMSVGFTRRSSP